MIFKHQRHASAGKPVVIYNRVDENGTGFWTPLIRLLETWCYDGEFTVVEDFDKLLPTVEKLMEASRTVETA
jgi:hypothetical protein